MKKSLRPKESILILAICFLGSLILSGCFGKSDKDRERECNELCAKMTSMPSLCFDFTYYDSTEVDSIIVKEISDDKKDTVTHLVKAEYDRGTSWELKKEIPFKNEYLIIVGGETPHSVKNFKMGARPLCNMFDCEYEPALKYCEIDGEPIADYSYRIDIRKK